MRIKQRDAMDCGAACLASISGWYSFVVSATQIRLLTGVNNDGASVSGIVNAAEELGFEAKGVRCAKESLSKIPLPAIAHLQGNENQHFVVVYKITRSKVKIMDPKFGKYIWRNKIDFLTSWTGVLILMLPTANFIAGSGKRSSLSHFLSLINPHRGIVLQCLLGSLIYTILGLSTSVFIQKITDNVLIDGNRELLNLMGWIMIVLLVFQLTLNFLKSILTLQTGQKIDAKLISGYYEHLLHMPQRFFDSMRVGEMMTRISDAVKIRVFLNDIAISLVVNFLTVFMAFVLMFIYYWKLAILMLMIIPLYSLIFFVTNWINRRLQRKLMERAADLESITVNSLQSAATVKSLAIEGNINERINAHFFPLLRTSFRSGMTTIFGGIATEMMSQLLTILLLWIGAGFVLDRVLTAGELFSFFSLVAYFTGPMAVLIHSNKFIQDALIAADRLFEILDLEIEDESGMALEGEAPGNIRIENLDFSYFAGFPVLNGMNLTIQKGTCTAIVGESGSGKSTILELLQKKYLASGGRIYLDDISYRSLSTKYIRKVIGSISQNADFFVGSLLENIAIGDENPDLIKITNILKRLGLNDFIETLPEGVYTKITAHGLSLSGGQRQRLAIARSLYRDYKILLMDEPNSALDARSEMLMNAIIKDLLGEGITIIIVSHRLSTIQFADQIMFLENGVVFESGSHDQLLQRNGKYAELWKLQNNFTEV